MKPLLLLLAAFLPATPVLAQSGVDQHRLNGEVVFEGLGDLPGGDTLSWANGMSPDGSVVVGYSSSENGDNEAFRWEDGTLESLGDLSEGDFSSSAFNASANGAVVVGVGTSANGIEAFRWEDETTEGLGDLTGGGFFSWARGVSANGSVVVGQGFSDGGFEAFRWENGTMEGLGDLPGGSFFSYAYGVSADGSVVVGSGTSGESMEAFRWEDETMEGLGDLPGGAFTSLAYATSPDGNVVVGYGTSENGPEAFRWQDGVMEGLGDLPGGSFDSRATGVSADGSMVVGFGTSTAGYEAFIWTAEDGTRNLKDVLETDYGLDLTGWTLEAAYGISDDGAVIVGEGHNPDGHTEAWRATGLFPVSTDPNAPERKARALTNHPNPANASTRLTFSLEAPALITLNVYDALGRLISTTRQHLEAGPNQVELHTAGWPAGIYIARLQTSNRKDQHRFVVVH